MMKFKRSIWNHAKCIKLRISFHRIVVIINSSAQMQNFKRRIKVWIHLEEVYYPLRPHLTKSFMHGSGLNLCDHLQLTCLKSSIALCRDDNQYMVSETAEWSNPLFKCPDWLSSVAPEEDGEMTRIGISSYTAIGDEVDVSLFTFLMSWISWSVFRWPAANKTPWSIQVSFVWKINSKFVALG